MCFCRGCHGHGLNGACVRSCVHGTTTTSAAVGDDVFPYDSLDKKGTRR